jgi:hypothetical protein
MRMQSMSIFGILERTVTVTLLLFAAVLCCLAWTLRPQLPGLVDWILTPVITACAILGILLERRHRTDSDHRPAFTFGIAIVGICIGSQVIAHSRHLGPPLMNVSVERQLDPGLSISIPGAVVEFAGIAADWYGCMSPNWWHANGTPLLRRTWTMDPRYVPQWNDVTRQRLMAICARGQADPARILSVQCDSLPEKFREFTVRSADFPTGDWRGFLEEFSKDQPTMTMRVIVAAGPFSPLTTATIRSGIDETIQSELSDGTMLTATLIDNQGHASIKLFSSGKPLLLCGDFQLSAGDANGVWHIASSHPDRNSVRKSASSQFAIYDFPALAASDVRDLRLERRSTHVVEFRDVALFSHHVTSASAVLIESSTD